MKKIDFRLRPPYGHYLTFYRDRADLEQSALGHTGRPAPASVLQTSMESLLEEMDSAGIDLAVVPGRHAFGVTYEELCALRRDYPGRFIIFPSVDPLEGQKALDEIRRTVIEGEGQGIAIESGFTPDTFFYLDDPRLAPFFAMLEEYDIPLMINYSAHALHGMPFDPLAVQRLDMVARTYPRLTIIVAHGGWPWTRECIALAMINPNLYLLPDAYGTIAPGWQDYALGARKLARGKILFGSAHPLAPTASAAAYVEENWDLDAANLELVFYRIAARILKMDCAAEPQ